MKAVMKKNNMNIIEALINKINKSTIDVSKLLSNACYTGKFELYKYLAQHFDTENHIIYWDGLLTSLCQSHNHNYEFIENLMKIMDCQDDGITHNIVKIFLKYPSKIIEYGKYTIHNDYAFDIEIVSTCFEEELSNIIDVIITEESDIIEIFEIISNRYTECMNDLTYVCETLIQKKYNKCLKLIINEYPQFINNIEYLKYFCCECNNFEALDLFIKK